MSEAATGTRVATAAEDNADSSKPSLKMKQGGNEQELSTCSMPVRSSCRILATEQARQQMQAVAARGDYILAGKLQEMLAELVTVGEQMQQAAQQDNFILAGKLQAQLNTLSESIAKKSAPAMMASTPKPSHSESGDL